jgi:hypothetical protein
MAQSLMVSSGQESTLIGVDVTDGLLTLASCGDSPAYLYRAGKLTRLNSVSKPRLGALRPNIVWQIAATRALGCDRAGERWLPSGSISHGRDNQATLLRPRELSEALLAASRDMSDDVTVVTFVF